MTTFKKYTILLFALAIIEIICAIYPFSIVQKGHPMDDQPAMLYLSWGLLYPLVLISIILFFNGLYLFRKSFIQILVIVILNLHLICYGIYFLITGHL